MNRMLQALPGLMLVSSLAVAAWLISDALGGSSLLYAVVLGLMAHPLISREGRVLYPWQSGTRLAAGVLLKLGVALLGARITLGQLLDLGWQPLILVVCAVPLIIAVGVAGARLLGQRSDLGVLTGGAVAICGASAALALAALLPQDERNRRTLALTIIAVTAASLVAMLIYPLIAHGLELSDIDAGLLLGGSIHNVPQAVAAGFVYSPQAGETATFVKLLRVAMLVPVVSVLTVLLSRKRSGSGSGRPPLLPWFLVGFVLLVGLNNLGMIGHSPGEWLAFAADVLLLSAMAAIGLQSSVAELFSGGWRPLLLITVETMVLLMLVVLFVMI